MTVRALAPPHLLRSFPARVLARATGASVRTTERWRAGQSPRLQYLERLYEMEAILDLLGRGMSLSAKRAWLETPNAALDWARPIDRLAAGEFHAVRKAAESYVVGDFV